VKRLSIRNRGIKFDDHLFLERIQFNSNKKFIILILYLPKINFSVFTDFRKFYDKRKEDEYIIHSIVGKQCWWIFEFVWDKDIMSSVSHCSIVAEDLSFIGVTIEKEIDCEG
jgi:hypothetical protein